MTPARFTKRRAVARKTWPEVFHAIASLVRFCGLPIPVEVVRSAPGLVGVRLESNADACQWLHRIDPAARATSGPDGQLHARVAWLGWQLIIRGAPYQPPRLPIGVVPLRRADRDPDRGQLPSRAWQDVA